MKYFLISDNVDTMAGMALVGVRGVVVHEPEEMNQALEKACADPEIGRAAAAQDHHVDLADVFAHGVIPFHLDGQNRLHGGGVSAGEYRHDLHIFVLRRSVLYAAAQIAVTDNADPDFIHNCLLTRRFYLIQIVLSRFA